MRKILPRFFALVLCLSMTVSTALAAGLTPVRDYAGSGFTDVPHDWSYPYISSCYELGLMSGHGDGRFAPKGSVSVAEGITVAARVHHLWRGGDGVLPGGSPWYTGAVDYALENGLITQGQFSNYNAAAKRCQLADLLAKALPEEAYAAINTISSLPDVSSSTPYAESILKLYRAGILTGSDIHGTFSPNSPITRAELAAILCRLAQPDTRVSLRLVPKAADLTVRTSSQRLYVNGVPVLGLVEIDGRYYVPGEVLNDGYYSTGAYFYQSDGAYRLAFQRSVFQGDVTSLALRAFPPQGQIIGTADPSPQSLQYGRKTLKEAVYTLAGRYPMVSLDALGATYRGDGFHLDTGVSAAGYTLVPEEDVTGGEVTPLIRSTYWDTVTAIHDFVVNTLTYDPFTAAPAGTTQATYDEAEAAYERAKAEYNLRNNVTLAAKYGICQDYAELFRTMCIRAGIPCILVRGTAGGPHVWNMVYVDGEWRYVDCTWDDPVIMPPMLLHDYLLIGPDQLAKDHSWPGSDYPMPAQAED